MKPRGLYELLLTKALAELLTQLTDRLEPVSEPLRSAEAADRIALHMRRVMQKALEDVPEADRVKVGVDLVDRLLQQIAINQPDLLAEGFSGSVLRAIAGRLPDGSHEVIPHPLIPLLDTALLTNAPGEPRVGSQVLAEVHSADRIDVVMAFIRKSGIAPLVGALRTHCSAGRGLRVLTTTYTNSTEGAALDALRDLGADVRVSYDTTGTRLHAKSWLFYRESGFSTAYIGSSNLTHSAQVTGLEWNVRVSGARNPDVVDKVAAVFESYWNSGDFIPYDADVFAQQTARADEDDVTFVMSPIELRPEPFQERLLEEIALSRERGYHRNLLASATGTGKTVMAAIDYARLRERLPRARLLFVAHRKEILEQSVRTFRHALREHSFGELWVDGRRPADFEHVFASIQSLSATGLRDLDPRHFDIVIIDEFHHAAAPSYAALLEHIAPVELLGLTATPERSDGLPLLQWFDNRIAAELRLWDAIDQQRLAPFSYFGIHDGLDLREIPWRRGRGYDTEALTNLLTGTDASARQVVKELERRVDNLGRMRTLGFCVSVEHARFMARIFTEAGIRSQAVWADTPSAERQRALEDLAARRINVLFSVDLFNEGVDVPVVDTLLLLRPTDSPTLFLQQLGRGLRKSHGKLQCTVLDFVGHHRKEFRFDRRFRALLGGSRGDLQRQIEQGFPFLPAGCHMELDKVAQEIVLDNIRQAIPSKWSRKVEELRAMTQDGGSVTLAAFLREAELDVEDVYQGGKSWSDLRADAGLGLLPAGPNETVLRRACGRILHVDDRQRIDANRRFLGSATPPDVSSLSDRDRRLLRMLVASIADSALTAATTLEEACGLIWSHPQVLSELLELVDVLDGRVTHLQHDLPLHPDVPLRVHGRYTRIEILAAIGIGANARVSPWQTGVYWANKAKADLLAFTLDKTSGQFSPTTRYHDYAISRELIHWQSQSATREDSETGLRYRTHVRLGTSILLFARLRADDRAFWFLGPATYVKHESETPMSVTWRLEHPLPGDLFEQFAAAVA
jgi:superfamily II DNA or RNA helicase/HKD family nuclease